MADLKRRSARWIWIGAGGVLALFLVWMAWPRAQEVEMSVIDRGDVRRDIIDDGRTRIHDVFVVAAPVGGVLQRIELHPGDAVTRGQIVATIAPADPALLDARVAAEVQANIAAAQASLAAAEAALELARRDQERTKRLAAQGFASQSGLDGANAALRAARATVSARAAELQRARVAAGVAQPGARKLTGVKSPAAGRVLRVLQESEAVVGAGAPLIEIGDPVNLEVVAEFLSQDAITMRPGAAAFLEAWGGETPIRARVARIEPFAHTKVSALGVEEQRVNVIVRLEDAAHAPPLGHGFKVDVRVVVSERDDVLRVPTDALVRNGAAWAVFRVERGRAMLTPVVVGEGGERYRSVESGLASGDKVVLFPGDTLESGQRVKAAPRSGAAAETQAASQAAPQASLEVAPQTAPAPQPASP